MYFTRRDDVADDQFKTWQMVELPTDVYAYTMDEEHIHWRPNTIYRLRVTASNDMSEGPPSAVLVFNTRSGGILCAYLMVITLVFQNWQHQIMFM